MVQNDHLPGEQASPVKGPGPEMAAAPFSSRPSRRVGFYIDGFNLYHAIDALGVPSLKWLDLRSLCESYLRPGDTLTALAYFTALNVWDKEKRARHVAYITALESRRVEVIKGTFDRVRRKCATFDKKCKFYSEKKTDVGIAVRVLADLLAGC